jgi:hypothetical protein
MREARARERAMELTATPMEPRQRGFRAEYRSRIAGWYNGFLHVVVIYVIGLTAMYLYVTNLDSPILWWDSLTVPDVYLACNFYEW